MDPRALLQKADKTAASASSGFSFFGGRETKYQDAADLYLQAANSFKMQKQMKDAGEAFEKAAQIQTKHLNDPDDAANSMIDAFKAYRTVDAAAASRCLDVAVERYCMKGNFRRAATHKESLGDLYENELGDNKKAVECYEAAAGWYEGDNALALANKLWLKVADLSALESDYHKATDIYEKVAKASISNNLMKYSVKEYFLKAGICHLATGDRVAAQRAIGSYSEWDPSFASQRENMLLNDIYNAVEAGDPEDFAEKLYMFDQISKLDKWKTTLLLRVKGNITAAPEEGDDHEFA